MTRSLRTSQASCALAVFIILTLSACGGDAPEANSPVALNHDHYTLSNGLEVVLHVDRSDPVVAVALTYEVGSAKEVEGRTGFAHLFEHLFFLDSENLGQGGLDRLMTRVGSSTNGSTNRDRTNYFEVVPRDALEKVLWAEADKVGFFINTVTDDVLAKEKQVVKNEKRQGVDNQPYGHLNYVIDRALYPDGHPYRWQVIGSLDDLDAATLDDVHEFHGRWYGPGNALLVVSGDLDVEQTKAWIDRYFGEIPPRPASELPTPPEVQLSESRRLMHEDNFAQVPQLTLAWPSVQNYHPDSYPLALLARILTDGKASPFYQVLVEEMGVAPGASAGNFAQALAGRFTLQVRAYADTELDEVMAGVDAAFTRFEERGVPPEELARVKARVERQFYQSLSSVLGKAFQLAQYTMFAGSPGYSTEDLERTLAVTEADLIRVYEAYLKDHPHVAASFVPRGQPHLALTGSELAEVRVEAIVQGAEAPVEVLDRGEIPRTPSAIDRSMEPPFGEAPILTAPTVWEGRLANRLPMWGIQDSEVPLVQFELRMDGGMLLDEPQRVGVANLLAETMLQGTAHRTPEELELAIQLLGATIAVSAGRDGFILRGTTLARNFAETMALVEEILLEPRFDPQEFELARLRVRNQIQQSGGNPNQIAQGVFNRLVYGDHPLAADPRGTLTSVDAITMADLQDWHAGNIVPELAAFHVAGAVSQAETLSALEGLGIRWAGGPAPPLPDPPRWDPSRAGLYFVDVPGSAQSVLRIGYLAMAEPDPDYWPATVMNFRLGGGGFASELTQVLREGLGYTYGIGSGFQGGTRPGPFQISSGVRSNITLEALETILELVREHGPRFGTDDLEVTRGYLLRNNAGAFETLGAKVGLLGSMSAHGFPADFALRRGDEAQRMTVEDIQRLAERYLDPSEMVWLVVGDARTQLPRLEALGLGASVLVDREGNLAQ
ncbi:MAG: pitrilysin family protein [Gemmatimonadota bacterium]